MNRSHVVHAVNLADDEIRTIVIRKDECQNLDHALSLEWLETNGRGGFASGTVAGANTRRYHALLLTARNPPSDRYVLVNHVEEWVHIDGEEFSLSTNLYPGAVHPQGYVHCTSFTSTPWPTWTFVYHRKKIQREILCLRGRDLVIVRWKLAGATKTGGILCVRPMLTGRDYHRRHHENGTLSIEATDQEGQVNWRPYRDVSGIQAVHSGAYRHVPDWYRRLEFPVERERGLDCEEDWWSPGEFLFDLHPGKEHTLALSSEDVGKVDIAALTRRERARRARLRKAKPEADPLTVAFQRAGEAFLSVRGDKHTVVAGYPWFTDWGRDTFISLPGLCLVTGRFEMAWQIIESFSAHLSEGMVPNRFPDSGEVPEYNTIDASLWFVHAVDRYLAYSQDTPHARSIAWSVIKQILDGYRRGTRYNIHMDRDGLISGGMMGIQLTWMDAKIGDRVVTPRQGKPVEIQALWIRALDIGARLAVQFEEPDYAASCRTDRARAVEAFRSRFWYEDGNYLYDTVDGPAGDDASMRPNQIYAISLCDDLLTKEQARQILHIVKDQLLTPVGLRTLSPKDGRYRGRHEGGVSGRDSAYHQGTVWPYLLGPFVTAWVKTFGAGIRARGQARSFLEGLTAHLREACLGHVSEVFDGDPPHRPRGCPAQAWSIAEPLRAMVEDLGTPIAAEGIRSTRRTSTITR